MPVCLYSCTPVCLYACMPICLCDPLPLCPNAPMRLCPHAPMPPICARMRLCPICSFMEVPSKYHATLDPTPGMQQGSTFSGGGCGEGLLRDCILGWRGHAVYCGGIQVHTGLQGQVHQRAGSVCRVIWLANGVLTACLAGCLSACLLAWLPSCLAKTWIQFKEANIDRVHVLKSVEQYIHNSVYYHRSLVLQHNIAHTTNNHCNCNRNMFNSCSHFM